MEKIYLEKSYRGNGKEFTHVSLRRCYPLFDDVRNNEKSIIVRFNNDKCLGDFYTNPNKGFFDTTTMSVDTNNYYRFIKHVEARVYKENLISFDVNDNFDTLPENEFYIPNPLT